MKRYALPTTEIYSLMYKHISKLGYKITVPIFSESGYPEILTEIERSEFEKLYKEVTKTDYKDHFPDNE
jgi:hypothetical protein